MFLSFNVSGLFAVVSMLYPPRWHYNYSIALSTLTTALQYKVASLSPSKSGVTTEHVSLLSPQSRFGDEPVKF